MSESSASMAVRTNVPTKPDLCGSFRAVELSATIAAGSAATPGQSSVEARDAHVFCEPLSVTVPNSLESIGDQLRDEDATLTFRQFDGQGGVRREIWCHYGTSRDRRTNPTSLALRNCTEGFKAGDRLSAQGFELELAAKGIVSGERTVRTVVGDTKLPAPGTVRQILGATDKLAGVVLEIDASSVAPFSGIGLAEGPLEQRSFVADVAPGSLVVGPSVQITSEQVLPPGALRLTVPFAAQYVANLPPGTLETLRFMRVLDVSGGGEEVTREEVPGEVALDAAKGTLSVGLSTPGSYFPAVRDLTPLKYYGGPLMAGDVNVYLVWAGNFDTAPPSPTGASNDPRAAFRTFINEVDSTAWYDIATTYGISSRHVRLAGEAAYPDVTTLVSASSGGSAVRGLIQRAFNDRAFYPPDPNGIYLVVAAPQVPEPDLCVKACGWHNRVRDTEGDMIKYGFVGNADTCPDPGACGLKFKTPNGGVIDGGLSTLAHEIIETVTNPDGNGWHGVVEEGYSASVENADKCNRKFSGLQSSGPGTSAPYFNVVANGHPYAIQDNWVNQEDGYCAPAIESVLLDVTFKPAELAAGAVGDFAVRIANMGASQLDANTLFLVGGADDSSVGAPVPVPIYPAIPPRSTISWQISAQAPSHVDGDLAPVAFSFRLVEPKNNDHFFPNAATTTVNVRAATGTPPSDEATCTGLEVPASVVAGTSFPVTAHFHNSGTTSWTAGAYRVLAFPGNDDLHQFADSPRFLVTQVDPGGDLTATFMATAPKFSAAQSFDITAAMANTASTFGARCTASTLVTCTASCPDGWTVPADDPAACEYHVTTGRELYDADYADGEHMVTLSLDPPLPDATLNASYLRIDRLSGGCYDTTTPDAIAASCSTFSANLTQAQTGYPAHPTGGVFWYVGTQCDLTKIRGWTPLGQDTCHKFANLDAFWRLPPQCH